MLARAGSGLRPPAAGEDPHFDQQLSELTWGGEPLFLMMAALLASEQDFAAVLGLARDDLSDYFDLTVRDLGVTIAVRGQGFNLAWTTVLRDRGDPDGGCP